MSLALILLLFQAEQADLGLETRAPTVKEAEKYDLPKGVRTAGRIVASIEEDGPADKAGIRKGDALLQIEKNVFHSEDSLLDYLKATPPGTKVTVKLKRGEDKKEVKLTLGRRKFERKGIAWEFSGLEQLEAAIAKAKQDKKILLVGISGAET